MTTAHHTIAAAIGAMPHMKKTPWKVLVMGKIVDMVMAKANPQPVIIPVVSIPIAMPALCGGAQLLTSLARFG